MRQPTLSQLVKMRAAASAAHARVAKSVAFDGDLASCDSVGLGEFVSRAQTSLADLEQELDGRIARAESLLRAACGGGA